MKIVIIKEYIVLEFPTLSILFYYWLKKKCRCRNQVSKIRDFDWKTIKGIFPQESKKFLTHKSKKYVRIAIDSFAVFYFLIMLIQVEFRSKFLANK